MIEFFKENWLWIVVPLIFVLAAALLFVSATGGEDMDPFIYNL